MPKVLGQHTILVVDDVAENIDILSELLSPLYTVKAAITGEKAIEIASAQPHPDLILLDIMMPVMDGYEVCRTLKSKLKTKHIPIIFLSAKGCEEDIVKGFEVGGIDYVTKPFQVQELLARVKTHVEIKTLRGILPICASCKDVRSDDGYWEKIESYIESHSEAEFSHGLCPECTIKLYPECIDSEGNLIVEI